MYKWFLGLVLGLILAGGCWGQSFHIDSTRFITGLRPVTGINYVIPTSDKGILFVGCTVFNPGGIIPFFPIDTASYNVLVGKIDSNQQISWIKVFGGTDVDVAYSACQTSDGGYAILGETYSNNGDVTGFKGVADMWLLRLDPSGNLLWQKAYGSPAQESAVSIANTADHGLIMFGISNGSGDDIPFHYGDMWSFDWVVIKTDSVGTLEWCKDLGSTNGEAGIGSIVVVDTNYYLVSSTNSVDNDCVDTAWHSGVATGEDIYILKLGSTGNLIWSKSYGGSMDEAANCAIFDPEDSTIAVCGFTNSNDFMVTGYQGQQDIWVLKLNLEGNLVWQKTLGSPHEEFGTSICFGKNRNYVVYGWTHYSIGSVGQNDMWLFLLDSTGGELTNKRFGGVNTAERSKCIVNHKNGYAASGLSSALTFTEGSTYGNFDGGGSFITYIDDDALDISNISDGKFNIFPNPFKDLVELPATQIEICYVEIQDCLGQEIFRRNFMDFFSGFKINTMRWPSGLYMIRIVGIDGTVYNRKIIKI